VVPGRVAHVLEVVVLAACAHALLAGDGAAIVPTLRPWNTRLNWTMPALANNKVGSSAGTRLELGTSRRPRAAKYSVNKLRMAADFISRNIPRRAAKSKERRELWGTYGLDALLSTRSTSSRTPAPAYPRRPR
jgi:hypothetical protein